MALFFDKLSTFCRRKSSLALVGNCKIGNNAPILLQSMAVTPTTQTIEAIADAIEIIEAGGEMVRYTASSVAEAKALEAIKEGVRKGGFQTPLVADVHFNPTAAFEAAKIVEKVRINPGNFASIPRGANATFTDSEYNEELQLVDTKFRELLTICEENSTALRIGVNHGSLSSRIMSRYGDSIEGMCESAMEFLRICKEEKFANVVISMKSSNVAIMARAYRAITIAMKSEDMLYPLHLGVTEAGEGEDGRIRSIVGISTLLSDGIGDTLRVSLTEPPAAEIEVGKAIVNYINERKEGEFYSGDIDGIEYNPLGYDKRKSFEVSGLGGNNLPQVIHTKGCGSDITEIKGDYIVANLSNIESTIEALQNNSNMVAVFESDSPLYALEARLFALLLTKNGVNNPLVLKRIYNESCLTSFMVKSSVDMGALFIDGLYDGLWIENSNSEISGEKCVETAFSILQSSRARFTKTEFISCPGCGRTQFNIQSVVKKVKEKCSSFKGLKIAVMGCVVNGPGEMADADFGYIGAGKGLVNLYKGGEIAQKGVAEDEAVEKLVALIESEIE